MAISSQDYTVVTAELQSKTAIILNPKRPTREWSQEPQMNFLLEVPRISKPSLQFPPFPEVPVEFSVNQISASCFSELHKATNKRSFITKTQTGGTF